MHSLLFQRTRWFMLQLAMPDAATATCTSYFLLLRRFCYSFFLCSCRGNTATAQQQTVTQPTSFHHIIVLALCATVPRILGTHLNLNNYAILFYAQVVPLMHIACRRCHANYSLTWTSASRCHSKLLYDYCHWACNLLYAALAYNRWL